MKFQNTVTIFVNRLCFLTGFLVLPMPFNMNDGLLNQLNSKPISRQTQERVPGEYLVTLKKGVSESEIRRIFKSPGIREITSISERTFLLRFERDPGPDEIERMAKESQSVEAVQPNFIYKIQ